ncbi:XRE family transcriptional regulator [Acinetobacter sp. SFB]|uniref:helix-turn-helix domain-containing protein n=1 Tax=Acinetobacter sp. SFB TaxID=1805634 RepID=UPI0007D85E63|nr:helix-turn-helix domain-containing protein [Acinetobacter sp. SFB]OAL76748.1 XRE family transcriptional regulator [Acinetobacter sp. SFB]
MNHLNDTESRDTGRNIGAELLMAVDEILANSAVKTYSITQTDVALARQKSELSQRQFADTLGVSVRTLESWEQGVRKPSKAAQSLIKLFIKDPSFIREALR